MARTIGDGDSRDFDETRRLLYMALLARQTKKYNLAGTLVNALVHHHQLGIGWEEAATHIMNVIEETPVTVAEPSREWLAAQIARISVELGD